MFELLNTRLNYLCMYNPLALHNIMHLGQLFGACYTIIASFIKIRNVGFQLPHPMLSIYVYI